MRAYETPSERAKHMLQKIIAAMLALLMGYFLIHWLFVREPRFRLDKPVIARPLDLSTDRDLIRKTTSALVYHLTFTHKDACGFSGPDAGYGIQLLVMRPFHKDSWMVLVNPEVIQDKYASWSSIERTIGPHDPLCDSDVEQVMSFDAANRIWVRDLVFSPTQAKLQNELDFQPYLLLGAEAKCFQQLMRRLNMTRPDDAPCVKKKGYEGVADYLSLDVKFEL
jgi:hypothetical protein